MAQNYNLNSSFGLNVSSKNENIKTEKETESAQKSANLFDSVSNYVDKYENVFSGEVEKEIGMYSRQMMIVGMNMKAADKTIRNFDMNI